MVYDETSGHGAIEPTVVSGSAQRFFPIVVVRDLGTWINTGVVMTIPVSNIVDYCRAKPIAGLPATKIIRLEESVLNAGVRLVCGANWTDCMSPLLRELHWLRVSQRVEYNLCVLLYRCLKILGPEYLARDLHRVADVPTSARLLSASSTDLIVLGSPP